MSTTLGSTPTRRPFRAEIIGAGILLLLFVIGLGWAKWQPYWERTWELRSLAYWPGTDIFESAGDSPSLAGAWEFTLTYGAAVWKAALVALLVAAAIDALVPSAWLVRFMNRRSPVAQAVVGGASSLPSMMCTCCTAPVVVGMRRNGVSTGAALAYWVGNPLLNPAVIVFLALVLPWEYAATRVLVGLLVVVGASALIGRFLDGRGVPTPTPEFEGVSVAELPGRFGRSLFRFAIILVPEYLLLVFVLGLLGPLLSDFDSLAASLGAATILAAAVLGTLLVIPTGGEIPVITALIAVGAGAGATGALLVTLPALSIPSIVMVGRAMGWRATTAMAATVAGSGLLAGLVLAVLV